MLLRRIKTHVKNENWFAVAVDFFIVVVGVYVGINVDNWNDDRQERDRAKAYLERIRADLVADQETIHKRDRFWTQVTEYGDAAIVHAETGVLYEGSSAKTVLAYYQASQIAPYSTIDTTYEELKSSGDVRLIENSALLAALAEYYVNSTDLQAQHLLQFVPEYRRTVRGIVPVPLQRFVWAECHGEIDHGQALFDCDLPINESDASALLDVFVNDQALVRNLRFWSVNLEVANGLLARNLVSVATMIDLIEAELAKYP